MKARAATLLLLFFFCSDPAAVAAQADLEAPEMLPTLETLQPRASLEAPELSLPNDLVAVPVVKPGEYHVPPPVQAIPEDPYGGEVERGRQIFIDTPTHAWRYAGNGLSCSNCHLQEGRKPYASPMWAAFPMYPMYREKNRQVVTFEERIQDCFRFSMNGIAPTLDAPELRALVAYAHWLARELPIGVPVAGRGFATIYKSRFPSLARGRTVYEQRCVICHGKEGEGQKRADGKYQFPPLWGWDAFNEGAGMVRRGKCASFVRANMPPGQGYTVDNDSALDVCHYMWLQDRPWDPRKSVLKNFFRQERK